jgi:hypothetical protein
MKESLLLVFANKQDIPGGLSILGRNKYAKRLIGNSSNETTGGHRCSQAYPVEGQDMVCSTKLCDNRRRVIRRIGTSTFNSSLRTQVLTI